MTRRTFPTIAASLSQSDTLKRKGKISRDAKAPKSAVRTEINSYSPTNKLSSCMSGQHGGMWALHCLNALFIHRRPHQLILVLEKGRNNMRATKLCFDVLSQSFLLFMWRDEGDHCTKCCLCEATSWGFGLHLPATDTDNTLSGSTIWVTISALKEIRRDETFSGIYGETVHAVRELLLWLWGPGTRC